MTTADIFNKVSAHLLNQRERCYDLEICAYRGPNGTSCAVGCLIADEYYSKGLEGRSFLNHKRSDGGQVKVAVEKSIGIVLTQEQCGMLWDLQLLHDDDDAWSKPGTTLLQRWHGGIVQLAEKYGVVLGDEVVELMTMGVNL